MKFAIGADGHVSNASIKSSTLNNDEAESCLIAEFGRMVFDPPQGGGLVIVSDPFAFAPKSPTVAKARWTPGQRPRTSLSGRAMATDDPTRAPLAVVFRRREPIPPARIAAENTRGEALVGAVMEAVQGIVPDARIVSISRDNAPDESLTVVFVGFEPHPQAELRRAVRGAPMDWHRARTCVFATATELHSRLALSFAFYTGQPEEKAHEDPQTYLDFLRPLGFPEWFLDLHGGPPEDTDSLDGDDVWLLDPPVEDA